MSTHMIMHEGQVVGHYTLEKFPGCSAICISHHLEIAPEWRGKGIGTRSHKERLEQALAMGFKVVMATTVKDNIAQEKILSHSGWRRIREFYNSKSGHTVVLWFNPIADPYREWHPAGV